MDGEEQLALMRAAAKDRRDDLRAIDDDHTTSMATKTLILNQQQWQLRLMSIDENASVDDPNEQGQSQPFSSTPQDTEASK